MLHRPLPEAIKAVVEDMAAAGDMAMAVDVIIVDMGMPAVITGMTGVCIALMAMATAKGFMFRRRSFMNRLHHRVSAYFYRPL